MLRIFHLSFPGLSIKNSSFMSCRRSQRKKAERGLTLTYFALTYSSMKNKVDGGNIIFEDHLCSVISVSSFSNKKFGL